MSTVSWVFCFYIQPLPDLRNGCVYCNVTQVEFYVKVGIALNAAITTMHAEFETQKENLFEKKNNKIKHPLLSSSIKFISIYFLRGYIRSHDSFSSFHRPAKICVKSNLNTEEWLYTNSYTLLTSYLIFSLFTNNSRMSLPL